MSTQRLDVGELAVASPSRNGLRRYTKKFGNFGRQEELLMMGIMAIWFRFRPSHRSPPDVIPQKSPGFKSNASTQTWVRTVCK